MAYTLGDPFRPLRFVLRLNGLLLGLLLGLFCLLLPGALLLQWGLAVDGALWLWRLTGANLFVLGCFLLMTASQESFDRVSLIIAVVTHLLWALILFFAYFRQELVLQALIGQLLFVLIFALCLVGALTPLRYIRSAE